MCDHWFSYILEYRSQPSKQDFSFMTFRSPPLNNSRKKNKGSNWKTPFCAFKYFLLLPPTWTIPRKREKWFLAYVVKKEISGLCLFLHHWDLCHSHFVSSFFIVYKNLTCFQLLTTCVENSLCVPFHTLKWPRKVFNGKNFLGLQ